MAVAPLCLLLGSIGTGSAGRLRKEEPLPPPPSKPLQAPPSSFLQDPELERELSAGMDDFDRGVVVPVKMRKADPIVWANVQVQNELYAKKRLGVKTPMVTRKVCAEMAKKTKAMKCDIVTQISGTPEGCECQLLAKSCPPADKNLGFTGVSPSMTLSLPQMGGLSVILCMYWQWLPPPDKSEAIAEAHDASVKMANQFVDAAHIYAGGVKGLADTIWAFTPLPFPVTAPPAAGGPAPGPAPAR